ncbi:MAG: C40 family peptidase [Deltaproteobacteria bacterium]|nr:C40 family peptidase [Deltaproteobacteria bacterium]
MPVRAISLFFMLIIFHPVHSLSATEDDAKIKDILDRECTNLKADMLFDLIKRGFPSEIEKGLTSDLLRIMEGVVKRTDFDGIKEEKTVEIIRLVYDAFKKGAPLEYLDQIFDVAYAKTVSVDQLFAAANALKEFDDSDVPHEFYEEFVYRSIEDKWETAAVPVLARGFIYGVDRGLTPQRVALSIMIDLENGELKRKGADQLVLDAIKLVRNIEPEKWKPLSEAEKALAARRVKKNELERIKKIVETKKAGKETEKRKAEDELKEIRETRDEGRRQADKERLIKEMNARLAAYQGEILKYRKEQNDIEAALNIQNEEIEREKKQKAREKEEKRRKEIGAMARRAAEQGRSGNLDTDRLNSSIERYIGIPYRFGGDSENGIDCSAFTRRVYRDQGMELPRTSREQAAKEFRKGKVLHKEAC